jgi:hypothetical protein
MPNRIVPLRTDDANSHNRLVATRAAVLVLTASYAAVTETRELIP